MDDTRNDPPFWRWFFSWAAGTALVGYFLSQNDQVAAISIIALALAALGGYSLKASRLLMASCGFLVGGVAVAMLVSFCQSGMVAWLGTSGFVLSLIVTELLIAFGVTVTLRGRLARFSSDRPALETLDRWSGLVIGAGQGAILCAVVLSGLLVLEPIAKQRLATDSQLRDHRMARTVAKKAIEYAESTRESSIGMAVSKSTWFDHEAMTDIRKAVIRFGNPLTRDPSKSEDAIIEHLSAR